MKTKVFGAGKALAVALVLALAMSIAISPVALAAPHTSQASHATKGNARGQSVPIEKGWTVEITAKGTAFNMTDSSMSKAAQVSLKATVEKSSMGRAKLKVSAGSVKIGDTTYQIEKGKGIIALRSGKLIVHIEMTGLNGAKLHVVLKGHLAASIPSPFNVNGSFNIEFTKPQSKLAGQFFLELQGTLRRVA